MAYGLRYKCGFASENQTGWVYIYEDAYEGAEEELDTIADSVKIKYNWKGWEEPIIGLTASFSILNSKENFFTLLPLLTAEERKYFIKIERVAPSSLVYFEGYLNCENNEQKYLHKQEIRLNASSYLSKLEYIDSPTIETLENDTFINIIDDCLTQTGSSNNIRVNCSLYPVEVVLGVSTLFNECGIYKEVFWKNNIDRDSALEIIKKILTAFDCYIYWYNGYWYIERYADIWDLTPHYVQYSSGSKYWPSDEGADIALEYTPIDFAGLTKLGTSQIITIIPGQKQVEVNIKQQNIFNFVNNDYANATEAFPALADPDRGAWILWTDGSDLTWPKTSFGDTLPYSHGDPFRNIEKSVYRNQFEPDVGIYAVAGAAVWKGNYTKFRATVTDESVLTIKFKFGVGRNPFGSVYDPADFTIQFYWYLRNPDGLLSAYIHYDESNEVWERNYSAVEPIYMNYKEINGAALDPELWTTEVTFSIPLHELYDSVWGGDQDFVLCLGMPVVQRVVGSEYILFDDYRGDVVITMNSILKANYISGAVNTKFLNKKTLTQYFADIIDLGIKNGILYGAETSAEPDALDERTETWEDGEGSSAAENYSLAKIKIKDKFRLYNVSRQKITSMIESVDFLRPFTLFEDSNQAALYFVLVSSVYEPQHDRASIMLSEYDNVETINLT